MYTSYTYKVIQLNVRCKTFKSIKLTRFFLGHRNMFWTRKKDIVLNLLLVSLKQASSQCLKDVTKQNTFTIKHNVQPVIADAYTKTTLPDLERNHAELSCTSVCATEIRCTYCMLEVENNIFHCLQYKNIVPDFPEGTETVMVKGRHFERKTVTYLTDSTRDYTIFLFYILCSPCSFPYH